MNNSGKKSRIFIYVGYIFSVDTKEVISPVFLPLNPRERQNSLQTNQGWRFLSLFWRVNTFSWNINKCEWNNFMDCRVKCRQHRYTRRHRAMFSVWGHARLEPRGPLKWQEGFCNVSLIGRKGCLTESTERWPSLRLTSIHSILLSSLLFSLLRGGLLLRRG